MVKGFLKFLFLFAICCIPVRAQGSGTAVVGAPCPASGMTDIATSGAPVTCTQNGAGNLVWTVVPGGSSSGGITPYGGSVIDVTVAGNAGTLGVQPSMGAYIGNDGVSTNGSPNFTSAARPCNLADNGKLMIVVNTSNGNYPYGTGLVTQSSCSGNTYVLSGNAGTNAGSAQNFAIGTDVNPQSCDSTFSVCLNAAWTATNGNPGKTLQLPCGSYIYSSAPFTSISASSQVQTYLNFRTNLDGCVNGDETTFIVHPNAVGLLINGGTVFAFCPGGSGTTSLYANGINANQSVQNIQLTSLGGMLPVTAGKSYPFIACAVVKNVTGMLLGATGGTQMTFISATGGEMQVDRLNFQDTNPYVGIGSGSAWTAVSCTGQGVCALTSSVVAFTNHAIGTIGGVLTFLSGDYLSSLTGSAVYQTSGSGQVVTITGSIISCQAQGSGSSGCIDDIGAAATYYVFGNSISVAGAANFPAFHLGSASSVLDMSGTTLSTTTAGWIVNGTGTLNDRVGNTFATPLTQFTGKYVPVGGGSAANNSSSAATNFGTNLTATNVLSTVTPAAASYDVKIGFRQVTAGVGCGAGSNTVTGVLSWTSGGVTFSTGSNGVPALGTLTISANGAVGGTGTTNAYVSQPVHIDINTQVTFTTTSTLASTGCTTTPQYVVDFSNI